MNTNKYIERDESGFKEVLYVVYDVGIEAFQKMSTA